MKKEAKRPPCIGLKIYNKNFLDRSKNLDAQTIKYSANSSFFFGGGVFHAKILSLPKENISSSLQDTNSAKLYRL